MSPDFEPAYLFRARVYSNLDPDTKEGLAKPFYEKLVEKASADSVKYSKDILEAYNYLGYYYLVNKQYCESLAYWDKIVAIDPTNQNAKDALKDLGPRCPEFKSTNLPPK
jgi:tetratricopeptide (TPR) repeat protein